LVAHFRIGYSAMRIELCREYRNRPSLPPPFILAEHAFILMKSLSGLRLGPKALKADGSKQDTFRVFQQIHAVR
jgi:hypothetical protein